MPTPKQIESTITKEQLRANYDRSLKQIKKDYQALIKKVAQQHSMAESVHFMREFSSKVVNKLARLESDAQKLGEDSHKLPPFIKRKHLFTVAGKFESAFKIYCENESWLSRLTGADSEKGREESREKFLKRVGHFKEKLQGLTQNSDVYKDYLPFIEKFELGTLGAFTAYTKQLRLTQKITRSLQGFREIQHKGSLQTKQAEILGQVLRKLDVISNSMTAREERNFKQTNNDYKTAGSSLEQRQLLKKHMDRFQESLPLKEKLEFLERVIKSQEPFAKRKLTKEEKATLTKDEKAKIAQEEKERNDQWKADKKEFAPLFKRDTKAEKKGTAINIMQQLRELHTALAAAEKARVSYLEAEQKALQPQPQRKRKAAEPTQTPSVSVVEETAVTEVHKRKADKIDRKADDKYGRSVRFFQEAEQQQVPLLKKTEETVDMELEAEEENQVVSPPK